MSPLEHKYPEFHLIPEVFSVYELLRGTKKITYKINFLSTKLPNHLELMVGNEISEPTV
jgi:hypothetical protein